MKTEKSDLLIFSKSYVGLFTNAGGSFETKI